MTPSEKERFDAYINNTLPYPTQALNHFTCNYQSALTIRKQL